jgi:transposase
MYEALLEDHRRFLTEVHELSFQTVQQKFIQQQSSDGLTKLVGTYMPKLHQYEQEFDMHKKEADSLRKIPSFDGKKEFNNRDNLHRRVIDIFRSFLLSEVRDLREYLRLTTDVDQLSQLLSRIEILRFKSPELNLVYYLFTSSKRSIRIYVKLREEIVKECTFTPVQYLPISTHNSAKYQEKYHFLDGLRLSRKRRQWECLVNLAGFEYDDEFTACLFGQRDEYRAADVGSELSS